MVVNFTSDFQNYRHTLLTSDDNSISPSVVLFYEFHVFICSLKTLLNWSMGSIWQWIFYKCN